MSVFCLTYNHVEYIREALDGFIMQKTNFKFNVFVFDDASNDGTSEILKEYQKKYSDLMDVYISPVNTYQKKERKDILNKLYNKYLTGKYIAWCEGDDAWTDPYKLQIQVDFMEKNPNCVMTTHSFVIIDYADKKRKIIKSFGKDDRYLSKDEVILQPNGNLATASLVMRRDVFMLEKFPECDVRDVPMQLYAVSQGDIYYINRQMSVYRYMHDGSWSKNSKGNVEKMVFHEINFILFLLKYNEYTKNAYKNSVMERIKVYLYDVVERLNQSTVEHYTQCEILNRIKQDYGRLGSEICRVFNWMSGKYEMSLEEKCRISGYKYIYIMGKGKYSKSVKQCLNNNQIGFEGYIISHVDNNEPDTWSVEDYPYDKKNTLVIVGISQKCENDIRDTLLRNNFKNVSYPLWFDLEEIYEEFNKYNSSGI